MKTPKNPRRLFCWLLTTRDSGPLVFERVAWKPAHALLSGGLKKARVIGLRTRIDENLVRSFGQKHHGEADIEGIVVRDSRLTPSATDAK